MKMVEDVVIRQVAGEIMLIPTGKSAMKANGLITLTQSGEMLVKKLGEDCTFDELVDCLLEEFEVSREQAAADVEKFLGKLRGLGLLCE